MLKSFTHVAALSLFFFSSAAVAAGSGGPDPAKTALLSDAIREEIEVIPAKPHFVKGITPREDPWEAFLEVNKVFETTDLAYGRVGPHFIDKSGGGYFTRNHPERELSEKLTIGGKVVHVLYSHHHIREDGIYTYRSPVGERNLAEYSPLYEKYKVQWALGLLSHAQWGAVQHVLGWAQAEAVKLFVHHAIEVAVARDVHDYNKIMQITQRVVAHLREVDPIFEDRLDEEVPGEHGLTLRDFIPIPNVMPEAFLPDLLVVGPGEFIGGFTNAWKKPGTEVLVFLDLRSLAIGYVSGKYSTTAHEFVHANNTLQGLPQTAYFDVEMFAEATTGLDDEGIFSYLRHPYKSLWRYLAKTYFGFDAQEVGRRIIRGGIGGIIDINEEDFRRYTEESNKVVAEFKKFVTDPEKGLMVSFYSDPLFWSTVNTKFCDSAEVARLLFALQYEPAGIFNPELKDKDGEVVPPAIQTQQWLAKEEGAGRIKDLAKKAMEKTGNISDKGKELKSKGEWDGTGACPTDTMFLFPHVSEEEERQITSFLIELGSRAKQGDREAQLRLFQIFGNSRFGMIGR